MVTVEGDFFDPLQVKSGRPLQMTSFRRRDLQRTDKEAVADYKASLLSEFTHWPSAAGLTLENADGLLKVIADKSLAALPGKATEWRSGVACW